MRLDVLVPEDLQRHVLALELTMKLRPIGLGAPAVALLLAGRPEERRFKNGVGQRLRERPGEPGGSEAGQCCAHRRRRDPDPSRHFAHRNIGVQSQSQQLAHTAHGNPLCRHDRLLAKRRRCKGQQRACRPRSPGGRHHPGRVGGNGSERRAASDRNDRRHHLGMSGRLPSESAVAAGRYVSPPLDWLFRTLRGFPGDDFRFSIT